MRGRAQGAALLLLAAAVTLTAAGLGSVDLALPYIRSGMARVMEARDRLDALEVERQELLDRRQELLDAIDRSRSAHSVSLLKAGEIESEIARTAFAGSDEATGDSAMMRNASVSRASPASTAAPSPKTLWEVGLPRR